MVLGPVFYPKPKNGGQGERRDVKAPAPTPSTPMAGWAAWWDPEGGAWIRLGAHLLLELVELGSEVGHQLHGGIKLVLKDPDLVLLPLPFVAHQGHGPHPGEPVQVLVLKKDQQWGEQCGPAGRATLRK